LLDHRVSRITIQAETVIMTNSVQGGILAKRAKLSKCVGRGGKSGYGVRGHPVYGTNAHSRAFCGCFFTWPPVYGTNPGPSKVGGCSHLRFVAYFTPYFLMLTFSVASKFCV
jgi:hypothetical protein